MTSTKINFTKAELLNLLPAAAGKRDYYHDLKEKSLILAVTGTGTKTFYLYRKISGKPERVMLGHFPDMTVESARKAAAKTKGQIADGVNPQHQKRIIRDEMTFDDLFTQYMEKYSKLHKRSWQYDEREVNKFLSHWFKRKISSITKAEISNLHSVIGSKNGLTQANRILERLRAIYNKAIEWGWEGTNPALGIKKFKEKSRERFLQPDELPRFFASLAAESNEIVSDYIMLSLLTGARKSNMLGMRWDEISFERCEWRIPETKNGSPLTIALSEEAIKVLVDRRAKANCAWVFPGIGKTGHLADPKKAFKRILLRAEVLGLVELLASTNQWEEADVQERKLAAEANLATACLAYRAEAEKENIDIHHMELKDLRIHDLRRTLGSWQASTGANSYVIGKSLGHKSQQATAIYARLNLDPVRESVEKATSAMFAAGRKEAK